MQEDLHNSMLVCGGVERRHAICAAGHVPAVRQFQHFASVDLDFEHNFVDFLDMDVAVDYAAHQFGHRVRNLFGKNISESSASLSHTVRYNLQANAADRPVSDAALCHWIPDDVVVFEIPIDGLSIVVLERCRMCDGRMDCQQCLPQ